MLLTRLPEPATLPQADKIYPNALYVGSLTWQLLLCFVVASGDCSDFKMCICIHQINELIILDEFCIYYFDQHFCFKLYVCFQYLFSTGNNFEILTKKIFDTIRPLVKSPVVSKKIFSVFKVFRTTGSVLKPHIKTIACILSKILMMVIM